MLHRKRDFGFAKASSLNSRRTFLIRSIYSLLARTPGNFHFNSFQDFFRNPTLTQNNRKYQTIENAENPVKSRAFGVLSFSKPETSDGARFSASKTISKDFLEKVLDKSALISPVASHILSAKSAATDVCWVLFSNCSKDAVYLSKCFNCLIEILFFVCV